MFNFLALGVMLLRTGFGRGLVMVLGGLYLVQAAALSGFQLGTLKVVVLVMVGFAVFRAWRKR